MVATRVAKERHRNYEIIKSISRLFFLFFQEKLKLNRFELFQSLGIECKLRYRAYRRNPSKKSISHKYFTLFSFSLPLPFLSLSLLEIHRVSERKLPAEPIGNLWHYNFHNSRVFLMRAIASASRLARRFD